MVLNMALSLPRSTAKRNLENMFNQEFQFFHSRRHSRDSYYIPAEPTLPRRRGTRTTRDITWNAMSHKKQEKRVGVPTPSTENPRTTNGTPLQYRSGLFPLEHFPDAFSGFLHFMLA
jgi:hypothetical protein